MQVFPISRVTNTLKELILFPRIFPHFAEILDFMFPDVLARVEAIKFTRLDDNDEEIRDEEKTKWMVSDRRFITS